MISAELHWLAGLIEGEGCFSFHPRTTQRAPYIRIQVNMTDLDVLERAHLVAGVGSIHGPYHHKRQSGAPAKPIWTWAVQAQADVRWLLERLSPLMGQRRQARIAECLEMQRAG